MVATLKDVARLAGVSIATASGALNRQPRVKETTRSKVLDAAALLKYRPNGIARDLKTQRTDTIAVFLHDLGGPFYSELMRGIQDMAEKYGYAAIAGRGTGDNNRTWTRLLLEGRVDGAIVMDPEMPDQIIRGSAGDSLPIVVLDRQLTTPHSFIVGTDNVGGACQATNHLLDAGASTVAFVSGPAQTYDSIMRYRGYEKALLDRGVPLDRRFIFQGNFTEQSGVLAAQAMVLQGGLPDAVFAANDEMAIGILSGFRAHGVEVPRDCLLVGFDDIRLAQYVTPSLTTVRQPMYELGTVATEVLFKSLQGERSGEPIILKTELVVRDSSRRVR